MKGKNRFTKAEIEKLEQLIELRNAAPSSQQKKIRDKMRAIGFYGQKDWGITDLQVTDFRSLIRSGQIVIIDSPASDLRPGAQPKHPSSAQKRLSSATKRVSSLDVLDDDRLLKAFESNLFNPGIDSANKLPDSAGNYIVCLRKDVHLPLLTNVVFSEIWGLRVVYTGIAGTSLRNRDNKHFNGNNAGRSTLRKSLGVLFGYKQIPRDAGLDNGKTKFSDLDEAKLSEWMASNLVMFFLPTANYKKIEGFLINSLNPPLNLKDNSNLENIEFRLFLSGLRRRGRGSDTLIVG